MYQYLKYLPIYLREVLELCALGNAADPPARQVYQYTVQKYLNQFIQTADIPTLSRWEAIFRMNGEGLDIEERRKRILLKFCLHAPITVKYLREVIEEIIHAACKITLDFSRYHMDVSLFQVPDESILDFLYEEIYTLKPANITMALRQFEERHYQNILKIYTLLYSHIEIPALPVQRKKRQKKIYFISHTGTAIISQVWANPSGSRKPSQGLAHYSIASARAQVIQIKIPAGRRNILCKRI